MCIDYRKLNANTIPDAQPIPRIQDILDSLRGQKWSSTPEMSKAYHQGIYRRKQLLLDSIYNSMDNMNESGYHLGYEMLLMCSRDTSTRC